MSKDSSEELQQCMVAMRNLTLNNQHAIRTYGLDSPLVARKLAQAGYPFSRNDKNYQKRVQRDYDRICTLDAQFEDYLNRIFWHGLDKIAALPANQHKNLTVSWLTIIVIAYGNYSPNVLASVRACEAVQTDLFPELVLMDRKEQNKKRTKLEELGLGDFHKGKGGGVRNNSGLFKLFEVKTEPTDTTSLQVLRKSVDIGRSLLVGGLPKDIFINIMGTYSSGYKAFKSFTYTQKEINAVELEDFKKANPVERVEEPKKQFSTPKPVNITPKRQEKIDKGLATVTADGRYIEYHLGANEKRLVLGGGFKVEYGRVVPLKALEPVVGTDFSHLLDVSPVVKTPARHVSFEELLANMEW